MITERVRDVLTPEQAADYLQINRETVYRYIREGKLVASKLGRAYRIPRASLDLFLWTTRTRQDITLRDYTGQEIADFVEADQMDDETRGIAEQLLEATGRQRRRRVMAEGKLSVSSDPISRRCG